MCALMSTYNFIKQNVHLGEYLCRSIQYSLIEVGGEALLLKTDKDGYSCLHIARQQEHLEIAKTLIQAGGEALLLQIDKDGASCLYIACQEAST